MPITVEGVENASVLEVLRTLGNLNGQGYLYGRPEDSTQTLARLAKKGLLVTVEENALRGGAGSAADAEVKISCSNSINISIRGVRLNRIKNISDISNSISCINGISNISNLATKKCSFCSQSLSHRKEQFSHTGTLSSVP